MNETILYAIITLCALGSAAAVILYFIAQKFKVIEDPAIDIINDLLPGANCGGCGVAGCRALAESMAKTGDLETYTCPVGGNDVMQKIAKFLGQDPVLSEPLIAVVRCNGSKVHAPDKVTYEGAESCAFSNFLSSGKNGCPFGCLGDGDCVRSCKFDALYIDKSTGLPEVISDKCVACGACVKACPRNLIELRPKGRKDRRIYVSCMNQEKGGVAKKNCNVACIGCTKCLKECAYDAISFKNNLAYIDANKCKLCRKCVTVCPTGSILELNFPVRKDKSDQSEVPLQTEIV